MSQKKQKTEEEYRKENPDLYKKTQEILDEHRTLLEFLRKKEKAVLEGAKPFIKLGTLQKRLSQIRTEQYIKWCREGLRPIPKASLTPVLDGVPLEKATDAQKKAYELNMEMSQIILPFSPEVIENIERNDEMLKEIDKWKEKEQKRMNDLYKKEMGYNCPPPERKRKDGGKDDKS